MIRMNINFEKICEDNKIEYGIGLKHKKLLLSGNYVDDMHFIYELIQNAEDVKAAKISFNLYTNRLEVLHNGKPFDENDVVGICAIAAGTKENDITKIGHFGLGFKSVYNYTNCPEIYSDSISFKIEGYNFPCEIDKDLNLEPEFTKFVFPSKDDSNQSFERLKEKLQTLQLRTILFLKNIVSIEYNIYSTDKVLSGKYYKENIPSKGLAIQKLSLVSNSKNNISEFWLPFSKKFEDKLVEVAFKAHYDYKKKSVEVSEAKDTQLVVYFPTEKETNLKFLIQGPFQTTPNRENIPESEWNSKLIEEIGSLTADTIKLFRDAGILDSKILGLYPRCDDCENPYS